MSVWVFKSISKASLYNRVGNEKHFYIDSFCNIIMSLRMNLIFTVKKVLWYFTDIFFNS